MEVGQAGQGLQEDPAPPPLRRLHPLGSRVLDQLGQVPPKIRLVHKVIKRIVLKGLKCPRHMGIRQALHQVKFLLQFVDAAGVGVGLVVELDALELALGVLVELHGPLASGPQLPDQLIPILHRGPPGDVGGDHVPELLTAVGTHAAHKEARGLLAGQVPVPVEIEAAEEDIQVLISEGVPGDTKGLGHQPAHNTELRRLHLGRPIQRPLVADRQLVLGVLLVPEQLVQVGLLRRHPRPRDHLGGQRPRRGRRRRRRRAGLGRPRRGAAGDPEALLGAHAAGGAGGVGGGGVAAAALAPAGGGGGLPRGAPARRGVGVAGGGVAAPGSGLELGPGLLKTLGGVRGRRPAGNGWFLQRRRRPLPGGGRPAVVLRRLPRRLRLPIEDPVNERLLVRRHRREPAPQRVLQIPRPLPQLRPGEGVQLVSRVQGHPPAVDHSLVLPVELVHAGWWWGSAAPGVAGGQNA
mmetsp:Transcript_59062/g.136224  ORF Transcript_59062/g.136224 Transcript_59062/m.136224 type:complete len:464 (-) Transcript_59062:8-1399(-)